MLAGNQLESLPEEMAECKDIELIRLSVNRLKVLPHWLTRLPKLAWIAYSCNPFEDEFRARASEFVSTSFNWSDIDILSQIGEGASGTVFKGRVLSEGCVNSPVAVKVYKGAITSDGVADDEIRVSSLKCKQTALN